MAHLTLTAAQAAAATSAGAATTLGGATTVQCYQTGSTARLITVQKVDETVVGTVTLPAGAGNVIYIEKSHDEEIFAANAEVLFTPCLYHGA